MNLRPVAAATALQKTVEFVATPSGFVIKLPLHRFAARRKTLAMNKDPGNSVLGRFHLTSVVAMETVREIFT